MLLTIRIETDVVLTSEKEKEFCEKMRAFGEYLLLACKLEQEGVAQEWKCE